MEQLYLHYLHKIFENFLNIFPILICFSGRIEMDESPEEEEEIMLTWEKSGQIFPKLT